MSNRFKRVHPEHVASPRASVSARGLMVGAAAAAATTMLVTGCGKSEADGSSNAQPTTAVGKLPQATTYTTLKGISQDPNPFANGDGTVAHPKATVPVSAQPGGAPVAALPSSQLGSPTWVPVVETKPGWQRVLLPSRPNRATGWIPAGGNVQTARSSHVIKVDLSARQLTIFNAGRKTGTWSVAVGAAKTPTPTGRTFLLASLKPAKATYSPLILPVGAHSETLDSFGGGPGTVAFHGWPTKSVFGQAVTHGCVRVPADALKQLSQVPLGTPVFIAE